MTPKGTLYIVATPIGNLEDITLRALKILKQVGLIAAEDTRHTRKLLHAYGIDVPLTSLYDQNELKKSALIISKLTAGTDVAYVSDAGTPGISDPGYILINQAIDHSITVVPVPGPSAVVAALSASGMPMDSFVFLGFLPTRQGKKIHLLESLKNESHTMVFYESPRRLVPTLHTMSDIFGDRTAVIARELTKLYEEIIRGTLSDIIAGLAERDIKGEITIIIAGAQEETDVDPTEAIKTRLAELAADHTLSTRDIVTTIAEETGLPRKLVYKKVLELRKKC